MLFILSLMPDCTFERSIWLHHYSLNVKKALWWEWEIPCLHMGVMPSGEPWPLLSLSLQRALPIVPITVLCRSLWMCVCVCSPTSPCFSKSPLPTPSLPFLFHTLSAVLTHSFWAGPKTGRAAPPVRNSRPHIDSDSQDFVTHSGRLFIPPLLQPWVCWR